MDDTARSIEAQKAIFHALEVLRLNKPDERSEEARRYAVTITILEQAYAYFQTFVARERIEK